VLRMKRYAIYAGLIFLVFLLIKDTKSAIEAAEGALVLCAQTVIPSLFPFFVISSFMVNVGFVSFVGKLIAPLAKRLFSVSGDGAVVFVMGVLCGYPTGAKMVTELYENKMIGKNEAVRLLPFCNNSGPLFVIGAVGTGFLGDTALGIKLYTIHVLSAVLTGMFFSLFARRDDVCSSNTIASIRLGQAFSDAVSRAVLTMLNVCGFIVFFSVLRNFFAPFVFRIFGETGLGFLLGGMAEVTLGAADICNSAILLKEALILLAGIIGFGGFCVFLQVCGIVSSAGIGMKTYLAGKLLQMGVSMALAKAFFYNINAQPVFFNAATITKKYLAVSPYFLIAFFFACAYAAARKKN